MYYVYVQCNIWSVLLTREHGQSSIVANPARGKLNWEYLFFHVQYAARLFFFFALFSRPRAAGLATVLSSFFGLATNTLNVLLLLYSSQLTDRASTIPSNIRGCQSGTWSQRGTKVNGSHHGDNPLLRPTGIQIATKSYATLQAMAPTSNKTVHQTSFTHIESSLDRLGLGLL